MKERGILLSTDGPLDNVIKIKPPLVFTRPDAGRVVGELNAVLGALEMPRRGLARNQQVHPLIHSVAGLG